MRLLGRIVTTVAAVVFLLACWRLGRLERMGPPHLEVTLKGGIPATFYLPPDGPGFLSIRWPAPQSQRPPVVILIHGFASDRSIMSTLARRLARSGLAVLAIDLRGHGANRNPFMENPLTADALTGDVKAAVDYARSSPFADGSRVIVIGHSMGAGAALDYAGQDVGLAGAVMISGGWHLFGAVRPRNALFIMAAKDPKPISVSAIAIASHLAGVEKLDLGKTYGDFKSGTAIKAIIVPSTDHISIIFSPVAAREIIEWCYAAFGMPPPANLSLGNRRLRVALIASLAAFVLPFAVGHAVGSLAPARERRPAGAGAWIGLAGWALALIVTMPLVSIDVAASFLSLVVGNIIVSWFALTGVAVLGAMALRGRLDWLRLSERPAATYLPALVGFAVIYALQIPIGALFHRMTPTPERLIAALMATLLLIPFFLGFEALLRRGGIVMSTVLGVLGRAITLVLLAAAVALGVMPFVVALILPSLVIQFILFEIFAASVYARSSNIVPVVLVESAWLGWIIAMTMPITIML
jgi:dienelactone hydrolase